MTLREALAASLPSLTAAAKATHLTRYVPNQQGLSRSFTWVLPMWVFACAQVFAMVESIDCKIVFGSVPSLPACNAGFSLAKGVNKETSIKYTPLPCRDWTIPEASRKYTALLTTECLFDLVDLCSMGWVPVRAISD